MQIDLYQIETGWATREAEEAGELCSSIRLQVFESLNLSGKEIIAGVEARFQELIESDRTRPAIVVGSGLGEPPGSILAAEQIHAMMTATLKRRGLPARKLNWLTDPSTGIG